MAYEVQRQWTNLDPTRSEDVGVVMEECERIVRRCRVDQHQASALPIGPFEHEPSATLEGFEKLLALLVAPFRTCLWIGRIANDHREKQLDSSRVTFGKHRACQPRIPGKTSLDRTLSRCTRAAGVGFHEQSWA